MPKRGRQLDHSELMRTKNESIAYLLLKSPWWVSAIFGILAFAALRWGLPLWSGDNKTHQLLVTGLVRLAPLALLFFALFAALSFCFALKRRRLVDKQTSLQSLRNLSWKDFEFLVAEAYRRQGYTVEYSLGRGADGGVDLTLQRNGRMALVQCKQWKTTSVSVPVIREMFGLLTAEKADEVVVITSGDFTREARSFAEAKPIRLVDGPQLLALVQSVQARSPAATPSASKGNTSPQTQPACPQCGKPMVLRTARRGANAGSQFWGCSGYPACKGTRSV